MPVEAKLLLLASLMLFTLLPFWKRLPIYRFHLSWNSELGPFWWVERVERRDA